ncbi:GNAT family N-acetyltransferase [Deinococcus taeanensis]|uniref:GNAT family N-acetyltransferase n=1 Tax=Deinococcus taeanensis TaxID=2737050 RepID=UPI001CDD1772|nr:GNAT family protein [Deinococcus taeanensis]UBV43489.1 GNAT family N-acetyltransferase [Deinococcus taeanensis]
MTLPAPDTDWFAVPTLHGRVVTLEALRPEHASDLSEGATEDTIRFLARGGPEANTPDAWAQYVERLNALPRRINFAVRDRASGRVVGRISYSEVNVADRWVEVGTMLLPAAQGSGVNPEAKRLLMGRAFEVLGAQRVQFKVDALNERSLRAMRRLGAVQEGVLRQYQVRPDGRARDSVMFSVLAAEWPEVRAGLEARLDALAAPVERPAFS